MTRERAARRPTIWLLMALLLAVLAPALAGAEGAGSASRLEVIRGYMEKGQALFVGGDLEAAARVFDEGYQKHPYSAFLFNAGVCYQKLGKTELALERFREYVRIDPTAPDVGQVQERITRLEAVRTAADAGAEAGVATDAGVTEDGGAADAGPSDAAAVPAEPETMKSLVVIETNPSGAPLTLYLRAQVDAPAFRLGADHPGWTRVAQTTSPASLTLAVGHYHVVVEKFGNFNESQENIDVTAGQVLHFQASLSQGAFMGFLRVTATVKNATVYLDDDAKQRPAWGQAPHGELVAAGRHHILVAAPGFEPAKATVELASGDTKEVALTPVRVGYGRLLVDADVPEITVTVDGKPAGKWRSGEPPLQVQVDAGRRRLVLSSPGRKAYQGWVEVPKGQALPVHGKMMPTYPRGAAWAQAIIGGVVLGAATTFGIESNRIYGELRDDRRAGHLAQDDSRLLQGQIYSVGADIGFLIGGALGVLATYNFVRDPLPGSRKAVDAPMEFDDPRAERPVEAPAQRAGAAARGPRLRLGPELGQTGGALRFGGSF